MHILEAAMAAAFLSNSTEWDACHSDGAAHDGLRSLARVALAILAIALFTATLEIASQTIARGVSVQASEAGRVDIR